MKTTLYWIFSVLIFVTACHKRTDIAPDYNTVSRIVGPEGKKLDIFMSDGSTRIATIIIPPGALDQEVEIGITLKSGYPGLVLLDSLLCYEAVEGTEFWEFSPRGLTFKKPVEINIVSLIPKQKFFTLNTPLGDDLNPGNWKGKEDFSVTEDGSDYIYQFNDTVFTPYFITSDFWTYSANSFFINGVKYKYTKEGPYFENGYYYVLYKYADEETQVIFAESPLPNKKYKIYNSYQYDFMPADQVDYCMIRQYDGNEEYLSVSGEIIYRSWFNDYGSATYYMLSNNVLLRTASGKEKRLMGYSTY